MQACIKKPSASRHDGDIKPIQKLLWNSKPITILKRSCCSSTRGNNMRIYAALWYFLHSQILFTPVGARTRWIIHNLQPAKPQDVLILIALFRPRPSQVKSEDVTKNKSSMGNGLPWLLPPCNSEQRKSGCILPMELASGPKNPTWRGGDQKKNIALRWSKRRQCQPHASKLGW